MTEKKNDAPLDDLNKDLAEANAAVGAYLDEQAVSQGAHRPDAKVDSSQNDPKNAPDLTDEKAYGSIEEFEKKREDRLKEAAKDLKKS